VKKLKAIGAVLLKTVLPAAVGLAVLIGVIAWLAGVFGEKIEGEEVARPPRKIGPNDQTSQVHEVVKDYFAEPVGTLKAADRTEISARILAPINRIPVSAGDPVQEGDLLIELDAEALKTKHQQALASLAAADAAVTKAKDAHDRAARARTLDKSAISEGEMKRRLADLGVARANQRHARQAVAEAEVLLTYTAIASPRAGMIVDRLAEPGNMARPGVPLLVVYDPTSLRLEVPVTEDLRARVGQLKSEGEQLAVHIDALDRDVQATIDEIVPKSEEASRSFLVKVRLPRGEGLYEGMAGRLKIPAGRRTHLCLTTAAIERIGQLEFVDVVVDPEKGTLERRLIKTGRLGMPGRIEVLSGLKAGELVRLRSNE